MRLPWVMFFDKIQVDDPVGAISVHLVCGIWGTLAVGLFGAKAGSDQCMVQLLGVVSYGVVCLIASVVFFGIIKATMGLRVSQEEEWEGLDLGEHGQPSYNDFMMSSGMR